MSTTSTIRNWQEKLVRSGYFFVALLLHILIFLMVATVIIFRAHPPPPDLGFQPAQVKIAPPPPPLPPSSGEAAANQMMEPTPVVAPPPSVPPSVIATTAQTAFNVKMPKATTATTTAPSSSLTPTGADLGKRGRGGLGSGPGLFGSKGGGDSQGMVGYLYDLKQTPSRQSTNMTDGGYDQEVINFVTNGWSESRLAKFYKSPDPLYTPVLLIPTLEAEEAPKNFGVEKEVDPRQFLIVYHCVVSPSEDGDYHFVGLGDDVLIVRVDGKNVLDASLQSKIPGWDKKTYDESWEDSGNRSADHAWYDYSPQFGSLRIGTTFHVRANESVKIDVLIGEEHGGWSAYFLMIVRDGDVYEKAANGFPKLPPFQIGTETITREGEYPPFSVPTVQWSNATN